MLEVELDIDLTDVPEIDKDVMYHMQEEIEALLSGLICQVHNTYPKLKLVGHKLTNLQIKIEACCSGFEEQIDGVLSEDLWPQIQQKSAEHNK